MKTDRLAKLSSRFETDTDASDEDSRRRDTFASGPPKTTPRCEGVGLGYGSVPCATLMPFTKKRTRGSAPAPVPPPPPPSEDETKESGECEMVT